MLENFLIVIKKNHDFANSVANEMKDWLAQRSKCVTLCIAGIFQEELREYASQADLVLVLGGDGTVLSVFRDLYGLCIPILGINFGRVGFLTEIDPKNWRTAFEDVLSGKYTKQEFIPLQWEHLREGNLLACGHAINDVVVARGEIARSISLSLIIDNIFLSQVYCDGIIVSAPLGATGYTAATGGPLVFPSLNTHMVTAISPFAGAFPPLVLPRESEVCITISPSAGDTNITIDGQEYYSTEIGDTIRVTGAKHKIAMLVSDVLWYWKRIGERGFIMPGPGSYTRNS